MCEVNHAAPQHHFMDKDHLLSAMQEYVNTKFTEELKLIVQQNIGSPTILTELGSAYMKFFIENPYFYNLVFYQMGININLQDAIAVNYPAFDILNDCACFVYIIVPIPCVNNQISRNSIQHISFEKPICQKYLVFMRT